MSTIKLTMLAETQSINRGIKDVNRQLDGFGKSATKAAGLVKGAFIAAGAAVAGSKIVGFLGDTINAASDLNEAIGKTEVIFGNASDGIIKFSQKAATALGQTQQEALDAASTFATFGKGAGLTGKDLSKFAKQNTVLASDLASFYNTSPEEAITALGAAFRGETEPIRRFGVMLDDASLRQEAFKQGITKTTKEALTPQQKTLAAQALILKQTGDAQGDFQRTSGGLANQQRILSAQFANLKTTIGQALLPVVLRVVTFLNSTAMPAFRKLAVAISPAIAAVKSFFKSGGDGPSQFAPLVNFIKGQVIPALMDIGRSVQNLIKVVMPIVNDLVDGFKSKWGEIRPALLNIWESIKTIVISALQIMKARIDMAVAAIKFVWQNFGTTITAFLASTLGNIITVLQGAFNVVAGIFKTIAAVLQGDWKGAWDGIKQILSGALGIIRGLVGQAMASIKAVFSGAWAAIKVIVRVALNAVKGYISSQLNNAKSIVSGAWNAVKSMTTTAWNGVKTAVTTGVKNFMSVIKGLPGKVTSALSGMVTTFFSLGADLIRGLINGIKAFAGQLIDAVTAPVKGAINKAKSLLGIASPSKVFKKIGQQTIQGFVEGVKGGTAGAVGAIDDLFSKVLDEFPKKKKAIKRAFKDIVGQRKQLNSLGASYEGVAKSLDEWTKSLEDLTKAREDYAKNVADNLGNYGSVTQLNSAFNADAMLNQLQARVNNVEEFATLIQSLKAQGLDQTIIDDLVKGGVEGGLSAAKAIQQGGAAAIGEFNRLQTQLNTTSTNLGNITSGYMYDAGIHMAQGMVNGLASQTAALEAAADSLAKTVIKKLKKVLKIKSPSRVFKELGSYTTAGLEQGLKDTAGVEKASAALGNAVTNSYAAHTPATTAVSGNYGNAPVVNNYNFSNAQFIGTTEEELARSLTNIQNKITQTGARKRTIR